MGQTVLSLGQNLLQILEKYSNEPYVFCIKLDQIRSKFLIQIFQKMLENSETEIRHELLMEIYKESLKGQYESDCIIFSSEICKQILESKLRLHHKFMISLMKIDENFVKGPYGSNCTVFCALFVVP